MPAAEKVIDKLKGGSEGQTRSTSHGRGGAGNINSKPINNGVDAKDLQTPHIKSQNYTTGRGGTGNIVPNENAAAARAAQDVDTPAHHSKELKGTHHWGRGGEGNMVTLGGSNGNKKERTASKGEAGQRRPSFSGVMERGKSMLGMGKKEGAKNGGSSSAVEEEK